MNFSIIIPTYNSEKWIRKTIYSVLAQTYTAYDLLILDSGSSDNTLNWIWSIGDSRIKVYKSNTRLSIEENWERIKAVPRSEFMTILGHDDILYPDFLTVISNLIMAHPAASLYHTHFDLIDAKGEIIRHGKQMKNSYKGNDLLKAILTRSIDAMGTGYVIRSKDYDYLGGIPVKYPSLMYADYDLWLRASYLNYEAIALERCFAFRVHQSMTHTTQDKKLHRAMNMFIDFLAELKERDKDSRDIINKYGASFLLHYCQSYAHRLLRTSHKDRDEISVASFIGHTEIMAETLGIAEHYQPEKSFSLKLSLLIDNNRILGILFRLLKGIYKKPLVG